MRFLSIEPLFFIHMSHPSYRNWSQPRKANSWPSWSLMIGPVKTAVLPTTLWVTPGTWATNTYYHMSLCVCGHLLVSIIVKLANWFSVSSARLVEWWDFKWFWLPRVSLFLSIFGAWSSRILGNYAMYPLSFQQISFVLTSARASFCFSYLRTI